MIYRTVYSWHRYDSLYSVIFSLSNIDCILTRTRVWGFALNSIPYGISIGADTVHSALFHGSTCFKLVTDSRDSFISILFLIGWVQTFQPERVTPLAVNWETNISIR